MADQNPNISEGQKEFLALLIAIGIPVSKEVIGELSHLSIKSYFALFNRAPGPPLIQESEAGMIDLSPDFPDNLKNELRSYFSQKKLSEQLDRIDSLGLSDQIKPEVMIDLLIHAGQDDKTAQFEIGLANRAQVLGKYLTAIDHLQNTITRLLNKHNEQDENRRLLISCVFDLSMLLQIQGLFREQLNEYLKTVITITEATGDLRNLAMAKLHLGSWQIYAGEKAKGLEILRQGKKIAEEINDEDIMAQSLPFREFCFYTQGKYKQVLETYDQNLQKTDLLRDIYGNYIAGLYAGASAAFLGQFHRALGILDSNWHLAKARQIYGLSAAIRALLGQVLLFMGKKQEAFVHFQEVLQEAEERDYGLARYIALGGLAAYYLKEGNYEKSGKIIISNRERVTETGMAGMFITSWSYEMFFELENLVQDKDLKKNLRQLIDSALEDINVGIKGAAKRLKAKMEMRGSGDRKTVLNLLLESETCLKESNDPIQLAKTRIELARLALSRGDVEESRELALKARKGLSGFFEDYYPTDLRFLLDEAYEPGKQLETNEKMENLLLSMIETLIPQTDCTHLMKQLLATINNFLQAKRIGLFWFEDPSGKNPDLRAAHNLSKVIVNSESFIFNMTLVFESFRYGSPLIVDQEDIRVKVRDPSTAMIICLPFEVQSNPCGVVYLDYSFSEYVTDFINEPFLSRLSQHIGICIERILQCDNLLTDVKNTTISSSIEFGHVENAGHPVSENRNMAKIYQQAGKLAKTDATILLMGETGTGKEHMARWIHRQSARADKPFIIIDPTTVTENLFESELFGHEKGAFTGANRQKPGRIELAHNGTLFIDEMGEIPLTIQVKLLRVLQEKTFMRVGGTRTLSSDFRLIVATNRDLKTEVAEGRFREDLYYRINIMAFKLLALRERKEDIIPLAEYFLKKLSLKYNHIDLRLSPENNNWLKNNRWPGNIRELNHTIEKAVLTSEGLHLEFQSGPGPESDSNNTFNELLTLDDMQRRYIEFVMKRTDGKVSGPEGAANILGMKRTTLQARMKKLGVPNVVKPK